MTHRVQQIMEAALSALQASTSIGANIEIHRVRSLADDQSELPAITINYGSDTPDEGAEDHRSIGSSIELQFSTYIVGGTESEVLARLLAIRTETHKALRVNKDLGLGYVWSVAYGGAEAPVVTQMESVCGSQVCRWNVRYVMDDDDPE